MIAVANCGDARVSRLINDTLEVEPAGEYLLPITEVVPLQLCSYCMAVERGIDVDRPAIYRRQLSKAGGKLQPVLHGLICGHGR